jgi:hypothetical protein
MILLMAYKTLSAIRRSRSRIRGSNESNQRHRADKSQQPQELKERPHHKRKKQRLYCQPDSLHNQHINFYGTIAFFHHINPPYLDPQWRPGTAHSPTQQSSLKTNDPLRFHQRDTNRSSLFSGYDQRSRPTSTSPNPYTASNGYSIPSSSSNNTFGAYPGSSTERANSATFRTATPDKRGAYSDAVLSELESQNDEQVSEMSKKVGMLKDVSVPQLSAGEGLHGEKVLTSGGIAYPAHWRRNPRFDCTGGKDE